MIGNLRQLVDSINQVIKDNDALYARKCSNCSRPATLTLLTISDTIIGYAPNCDHCGQGAIKKNQTKRTLATDNGMIWRREAYYGRVTGGRGDFYRLLDAADFEERADWYNALINHLRYYKILGQLTPSNGKRVIDACRKYRP